jgi:hypothetical protein
MAAAYTVRRRPAPAVVESRAPAAIEGRTPPQPDASGGSGVLDLLARAVRRAVVGEYEAIQDQELEHEHDPEGAEVAAVDQK